MSAYEVRLFTASKLLIELTDEEAAVLCDIAAKITAASAVDSSLTRMYVERRYAGVRVSGGGA